MDLLVLILILLSGYIIKYLIDTINTLNNEIREIKMKCISGDKDVKFDSPANATATAGANAGANANANATAGANANAANAAAGANAANAANAALIKNITYFKDYFDT